MSRLPIAEVQQFQSRAQCFYRVSIKALIRDSEGRYLLIQESNGKWELPGGGLDYGESPQEGLKREVKEEMGVNISTMAHEPSVVLTLLNDYGVHMINICYKAQLDSLSFISTDECVAVGFFSLGEMKSLPAFKNVYALADALG